MTAPTAPEPQVPPSSVAVLQESAGFVVELEQFSGPLDLLLHLIREDEVDITDLPIAKIADQFLAVIHELGLDQAADYLEMAARLLRIKAQMLLPRRLGDDEWEDPRSELVRRLLEYQQIRELVAWLQRAAARRAEQFGRGYEQPQPDAPPAPLQIELNELLAAAERVITLIPEPMLHRVVPRPLDVEGATERILALLAEHEECGWSDVVGLRATIVEVLSAFIALLELAKRGSLTIRQPEPFAPMVIRRESPREVA
ncbi:MAG: segregation/condensation protein A [Gemmatimonadetes bacterium]|nr:segregation/condensation protein A [Gemmatimonadota bacterium]